ncbi:MAG: hypothetical protein EOO60_09470 [Hymenobacter sp.]|nr:MAG: hypothetical protein EOO60_09470 [Hymenobacter sp.]
MPESQPQEKKPIGRPSDYTDGLADAICERLIMGESMAKICLDDKMPAEGTAYRWLQAHEYFRERYAHAREVQAHRMGYDILDIADDTSSDTVYGDSGPKPNTEWISRSKLRVDARFKLMALLAPKVYGAKLALDVNDTTPANYKNLSDSALEEVLNATRPDAE